MIDDRRLGMQLGASAYLVKPATAAEVQATVAQFIHSQGRILVIDDDADARAIVVDYLQQHGEYEVMTATNGREALATVTTTTPDLILLDLMMPEMDGFTVLNHLSQNATTAQISRRCTHSERPDCCRPDRVTPTHAGLDHERRTDAGRHPFPRRARNPTAC
jgi:CheY-like chemotaxis protein